jgi:hypothetical protein
MNPAIAAVADPKAAALMDERRPKEPPMTKKEGMIKLRVLSPAGDDRLAWDRRFLDQVHEARQKFYDLLAKGYKACRVDARGRKSELIFEFDPDAEEIVFVGAVVGG